MMPLKKWLATLEEIRRLSFRLSHHEEELRVRGERLAFLSRQVKAVNQLKKTCREKSAELTEALDHLKTISR